MEVTTIDLTDERTNVVELPAKPPLRPLHHTLKSAHLLYVVRTAADSRYIWDRKNEGIREGMAGSLRRHGKLTAAASEDLRCSFNEVYLSRHSRESLVIPAKVSSFPRK